MPEEKRAAETSRPPAPLRSPNDASALQEITERADTVWTGSRRRPKVESTGRREIRGPGGRVAIVDGCRTPFAKSGTDFQNMDVIDLASTAVAELVSRTGIDPAVIEMSVFGCVIPALHAPNLGREVVFRTSLPMDIPGTTVNLACTSSNRAITFGAEAILAGEVSVVLAGGAESLSNVPIQFSKKASRVFMELNKAKSVPQRVGVLSKLRPADLSPPPSPSTRRACRWASRRRRWPRRTTSPAAPRTRSPSCPMSAPPRRPPTAASPSRSPPPSRPRRMTRR